MQVDYALILSAGLGTRMGEIGKSLPKVMWPILNLRLIDLQIAYCRELNVKKIFINTHYLSHIIEEHIKKNASYADIVILQEDPLLDSGGAIHNMAKHSEVNYKGNVLTVNGDQFLFFDNEYYLTALDLLKSCRGVLFGINVDKSEKYNETVLDDDSNLIEIRKTNGEYDFVTFSGLGLIKLDGLQKVEGPSKFFQTVVNFKDEKVKFITPKEMEYWDFGTAPQYMSYIKKLFSLESMQSLFYTFLLRNNIKIETINQFYDAKKRSIDLESKSSFENNKLIYKHIQQEV